HRGSPSRNALPQVQCTDDALRQEAGASATAELRPLPADHDEIASRGRTGGDGEGMRADDRETVALVEAAGAIVLLPDIEKDLGRLLEARMIEGGIEQSPSDAAGLKGRLDIEPPQLLVAG